MASSDLQNDDEPAWIYRFVNLPRQVKRFFILLADLVLLSFALWAALSLRLATWFVPDDLTFTLLLGSAPLIGVAVFHGAGLYRLVTRYISSQGTIRIFAAVAISVLIWSLVILLSDIPGVPRSVVIIYGLLSAFLVSGSRQLAGWLLRDVPNISLARFDADKTNILIFGAGPTGVQLQSALKRGSLYRTVGFVDENENLWRQIVAGVKVYRPSKIAKLIEKRHVREIFLAMPGAPRHKRQAIIRSLEDYQVVVKILPAIEDIASGRVEVADLRPVDVEDLLGRDAVPPDQALLTRNILGKSVLVTGAGGSIGSELARQVLKLSPRRIVLFDLSEAALYEIEHEISESKKQLSGGTQGDLPWSDTEIVCVLGSVGDEALMHYTFKTHEIDTIFHAAAYKHVPIVELNPISGLNNNTFGTDVIARAARDAGVERFVLVSTDKAVRPTNIMGASKRLAELILQAHATDPNCKTVFTMVRFGNVLDSSGSVVHRFRQQIKDGGPVTVTHRDIIRYFMSIPEAAELVIQAGAIAEGGDVFVLDMGKPIKIADLARLMIRLMGLEVQDKDNPLGDVAIEYVGLRQGEKLYEELLIGEQTVGTSHPRIMRSSEPHLSDKELRDELAHLRRAICENDIPAIMDMLKRTVEGFSPDSRLLTPSPQRGEDWLPSDTTIH